MRKMQIFELAMCCLTSQSDGSPELLRISAVLNSLKKNGIEVDRFNLSDLPMEFINNKEISQLICNKECIGKLPITVLDEKIVVTGRYPTSEEFANLFNIPMNFLGDQSNCFSQPVADNK